MRRRIVQVGVVVLGLTLVILAALPAINDPEVDVLDDEQRRLAPGRFVDLAYGKTHYELAGPREGPGVVLVHGGSVPFYIWDDTFRALSEAGFRVLRYDQYGRGYSDRPEAVYDRELLQGQLAELVASVPIDPPLVMAGVSMGGALAVDLADSAPDLVRALVLLDPLNRAVDIGPLAWPLLGAYMMSVSVAPGMAQSQLNDFYRPERFPDWPSRYRPQMRFRGFRRATLSIYRNYITGDIESRYRRVAERGLPVLLIWGEHDTVVPFAEHREVRETLGAELFIVPEAGHIPQVERPAVVNARILEFLRRLEAPTTAPEQASELR